MLTLSASRSPADPLPGVLKMGSSISPDGSVIEVDSRSLLLNGRRWLPVSGEFHYSRYPSAEWRAELLKMRAGGVDIVATYSFWIHHEEEQGVWDWSGRREFRRFVELCRETGLFVIARIGPWAHGECRNGGLPDWVLKTGCKTRSDDPAYLKLVTPFYDQISAQLSGLLWKDGGPVIAAQCENEFGGPAEHLITLKRMAISAGIDTPIYTFTAWAPPSTPIPTGELLPVFGGYAQGFWNRELTPEVDEGVFRFSLDLEAKAAAMGVAQTGASRRTAVADVDRYPYCCAELGGGMSTSYHRRICIGSAAIESGALVKIGSGCNLLGYYMYHGGTNPDGKLTTMQESQATGYWNDVPVKSYDFYAPLGEFGQVTPHYHGLRRLHLFLHDWGEHLAALPAVLPNDPDILRWSARTDGHAGFAFVNNYQWLQPMPSVQNVQLAIELDGETLTVPEHPITVPADAYFFWPFNMAIGDVNIVYATAQPICLLEDGDTSYAVFGETEGVPAEFVFDASGASVASKIGRVDRRGDRVLVGTLQTGTGEAIRVQTDEGRTLVIILLSDEQSRSVYKAEIGGRQRIVVTRGAFTVDGDRIALSAFDVADLEVSILPALDSTSAKSMALSQSEDGLFRRYSARVSAPSPATVSWAMVKPAGPARSVKMGSQGVAESPSDAEFQAAGVWSVRLICDYAPVRDLILRIHYVGDAARVRLDTLLTDNFYNGRPFDVGLVRFAPKSFESELRLEILPLSRNAPIYLDDSAKPDFGTEVSAVGVSNIEVLERFSLVFNAL